MNDRVKLLAYRVLDAIKAKPKSNGEVPAQPDASDKPAPKTEAVAEPNAKAGASACGQGGV